MTTKPLILCSLMLILLGTPCRTPAAGLAVPADAPMNGMIYYVAPTGNDEHLGNLAYPWRTVQKAADTLVAGDTVYIRAGVYNEQVIAQNSGSAGQPITYAAYPGETATLDGSGIILPDDLAGLFHVSGKSHIVISGLRVVNAGPYGNNAGILVNDSSYITVTQNSTYNTVSSGIGVWGSNDVVVNGNRVDEAGGGGWQECISVAETDTLKVRKMRCSTATRRASTPRMALPTALRSPARKGMGCTSAGLTRAVYVWTRRARKVCM